MLYICKFSIKLDLNQAICVSHKRAACQTLPTILNIKIVIIRLGFWTDRELSRVDHKLHIYGRLRALLANITIGQTSSCLTALSYNIIG
jgi:hypothetical protein